MALCIHRNIGTYIFAELDSAGKSSETGLNQPRQDVNLPVDELHSDQFLSREAGFDRREEGRQLTETYLSKSACRDKATPAK